MGNAQIKAVWTWYWSAAVSKSTREGHYIPEYGSKLYGLGTGLLQYRNRLGRDIVSQSKGKFIKLGGGKLCSGVYGFALSFGCKARGPSATASI